jgi:hypothetical protein
LNSGTPFQNIGVCQCTHSSTPTGWTMAMLVSPRKRFGKIRAWAGPSRKRRWASSGPSRRVIAAMKSATTGPETPPSHSKSPW